MSPVASANSAGLKLGVCQHQPFATALFEAYLDAGMLALTFNSHYGADAEFGMLYSPTQGNAIGLGLGGSPRRDLVIFSGCPGTQPRTRTNILSKFERNL